MVKMIDNYLLKDIIGEGSFGKVYKATHSKKQGEYAVKIIPVSKFHQNSKLQQCTFNEIKTLSNIGHAPNIVRYYEMLKTKNNYYFIYEYCNGGTLLQKIKKQGCFSEKKALMYFKQLLDAFKVLNRCNIMHRDIKAQNIFFHNDCLKLGDFGFCKGLGPQQNLAKTMLGSPLYMAPQVLKGQPYTTKADIWSLGVILYEMLYGVCPFQSNSIAMLINTINTSPIQFLPNFQVSQNVQSLIRKMLTKDYFRRIGWVQLFAWGGVSMEQNDSHSVQKKSPSKSSFKSGLSSIENDEPQGRFKQKKTSSIPKNKPQQKKLFYSQKYMELMNSISKKPTVFEQITSKHEIDIKTQPIGQRAIKTGYQFHNYTPVTSQNNVSLNDSGTLEAFNSPKGKKTSDIDKKRQTLLKVHEQCLQTLRKSLSMLQNKQRYCISYIYENLSKIRDRLKNLTKQINISEIQLLDLSSLVNYEILQVDRQILQFKQQMMRLSIDIPESSKILQETQNQVNF